MAAFSPLSFGLLGPYARDRGSAAYAFFPSGREGWMVRISRSFPPLAGSVFGQVRSIDFLPTKSATTPLDVLCFPNGSAAAHFQPVPPPRRCKVTGSPFFRPPPARQIAHDFLTCPPPPCAPFDRRRRVPNNDSFFVPTASRKGFQAAVEAR